LHWQLQLATKRKKEVLPQSKAKAKNKEDKSKEKKSTESDVYISAPEIWDLFGILYSIHAHIPIGIKYAIAINDIQERRCNPPRCPLTLFVHIIVYSILCPNTID
jgi:hypothetical protein